MIRSYRNAALCTGRAYFLEEEKAREDSERGFSGYWFNCQWVRSVGDESVSPDTRGLSPVSDPASDSTCFGTNCQLDDTISGSGALVGYESDSTCDTGMRPRFTSFAHSLYSSLILFRY